MLEMGHQVRGVSLERQPCITAAAAGGVEGWGRMGRALSVTSAYVGPVAALYPHLPLSGAVVQARIGRRLFCCIDQPVSLGSHLLCLCLRLNTVLYCLSAVKRC